MDNEAPLKSQALFNIKRVSVHLRSVISKEHYIRGMNLIICSVVAATAVPTDQKRKVTASLRDGIKENHRLASIISYIKENLGSDAENILMEEALYERFVEDGKNVLMQAAAYGRNELFVDLTKTFEERVSFLRVYVCVELRR